MKNKLKQMGVQHWSAHSHHYSISNVYEQFEAQACMRGILWAMTNSFTSVMVYTDSELLVTFFGVEIN